MNSHASPKYVPNTEGLIIFVGLFLFYCKIVWFASENKYLFTIPCRFLLQCLEDLDANLRKLNSRLFVIRGQPADVFPRLFKVNATLQLLFLSINMTDKLISTRNISCTIYFSAGCYPCKYLTILAVCR